VPKIYGSKSKVNLPVEALQSTHWETYRLSRYSHVQSVSGVASVIFVYISSLKVTAPFSKCTAIEQRTVIQFLGVRRQ